MINNEETFSNYLYLYFRVPMQVTLVIKMHDLICFLIPKSYSKPLSLLKPEFSRRFVSEIPS